jgi:flagellar hook-associated protein 1 FlgK
VSGVHGGGVKVTGVERAGNPLLTADRRRIEAGAEKMQGEAEVLRRLSDIVSDPDGGDSLASRYTAFENALRALADTPESASTQAAAAAAGRALSTRFNTISTEINRLRTELADDVKTQVDTVNTALKKIAQLNTSIAAGRATGKDVTALEDERDRQLEIVNRIVPIRSKDRESGGMMVSSSGGTLLVEGSAREIVLGGPATAPTFTVDGFTVGSAGPGGGLQGGTLEAAVAALTQTLPGFEGQVGAMVFDLVERFQTLPGYDRVDGTTPLEGLFVLDGASGPVRLPAFLSLDDTVTGGNIDLFRDAYGVQGADDIPTYQALRDAEAAQYAIDFPGGTADFARALRLNPTVDPQAGGDASRLWRRDQASYAPPDGMILRDTGQSFPSALMAAMRSTRPSQVAGLSGSFGATDLAIGLTGLRETDASTRETDASFQRAATLAVHEQELAGRAVDTDAELQDLLRIEQAYAANARVLDIANAMIDTLLEI